jgi:hypothetical protein
MEVLVFYAIIIPGLVLSVKIAQPSSIVTTAPSAMILDLSMAVASVVR